MFSFILSILSLEYTLEPHETLELIEFVKDGELFKFEFYEKEEKNIKVVIKDENGNVVGKYDDIYAVIHTKANGNKKFYIQITNMSKENLTVSFRAPDVKKEVSGPLGPVEGVDPVHEMENVLKKNIMNQRKYLENQRKSIKKIENNSKRLIWFFIFEVCFCIALGVYYQNDIMNVFEKKTRI